MPKFEQRTDWGSHLGNGLVKALRADCDRKSGAVREALPNRHHDAEGRRDFVQTRTRSPLRSHVAVRCRGVSGPPFA